MTEISKRIIELSEVHPSNQSFIDQCKIANHPLITDLRKNRLENPGAQILAQIVKGTGCSGTWLLTGEGKMFERKRTHSKDKAANYILVNRPGQLLSEFERRLREVDDVKYLDRMMVRLSKMLTRLLEKRTEN